MSDNYVKMLSDLGSQLEQFSRYGYSADYALAEFVDNSTQSYFDNKPMLEKIDGPEYRLTIWITYNRERGEIIVSDNAFGMDRETFQRALTLFKPPKKTSGRGEYGVGLKSAASWFGKWWSVSTTTGFNGTRYSAEVDIDELKHTHADGVTIKEESCLEDEHGTEIIIRQLQQNILDSNFDKLKKHLTTMYQRDITNRNIIIYVNGEKLSYEAPAPLVTEEDGIPKVWKDEFQGLIENEGCVYPFKGMVMLLGNGTYDNLGFVLFSHNRVIKGGADNQFKPQEIFGKGNSYQSSRLYAEIDLDDWPVTQSKDDFLWELNGLKDKFVEKIKQILTDNQFLYMAKNYRSSEQKEKSISKKVEKPVKPKDVTDLSASTNTSTETENVYKSNITVSEYLTDKYPKSFTANLLDATYSVTVSTFSDKNADLFVVSDVGGTEISVQINTAFPIFDHMDIPKIYDFLEKYLVILAIAEVHENEISTDDGLIHPYDFRTAVCRILKEIFEDRTLLDGFFKF